MQKEPAVFVLIVKSKSFLLARYLCGAIFFHGMPADLLCQSLKGQIRDTENSPLPFSTAILYSDTLQIKGIIADSSGWYVFDDLPAGKYKLRCTSVGYFPADTLLDIKGRLICNIQLNANLAELAEVTISARAALITRKADRYILNIEGSVLSDGYNALEILQRSPGMWITPDGVIRMTGKTGISVMVNGVLQRMTYDELQDYLKTIKSENISKIEVITNPGAEFDAGSTGGAINIITKKAKENGLQGNISNTYRQQNSMPYSNTSIGLNIKTGKFSGYSSAALSVDRQSYFATNDILYQDETYYNTRSDLEDKRLRKQFINGILAEISPNSTIGIQNITTFSSGKSGFDTHINSDAGDVIFMGDANVSQDRNIGRNATTINYQLKTDTLNSLWSTTGDFTWNRNKTDINFISKYSNATSDSVYRSNAPYVTRILSIQSDYKKNFSASTGLKIGVKFSAVDRNNQLLTESFIDNQWIVDSGASNIYDYTENIYAGYFTYNKSIGKTDFTLGLRGEYTDSRGKSETINQANTNRYFNVFPSFSIQRVINEKKDHSLSFSLNTPFTRPDFNTLNPYRLKIDNFNYQIGNPGLSPQTGYSFDLGVNLFSSYNMGVYYTYIKDVFANVLIPRSNKIIEYQIQNFNNSIEYGLYSTLPLNFTKWWGTSNDFQFYASSFNLENYQNKLFAFSVQSQQNINIKKLGDIDMIARYQSPYAYSNSKIAHQFNWDIGYSKKILKDKGKIRFLITDVTNTLRDKAVTNYNNTQIDFYQKRPTRTYAVSFSWKFSAGIKFNTKGVNPIGNDEKRRLD